MVYSMHNQTREQQTAPGLLVNKDRTPGSGHQAARSLFGRIIVNNFLRKTFCCRSTDFGRHSQRQDAMPTSPYLKHRQPSRIPSPEKTLSSVSQYRASSGGATPSKPIAFSSTETPDSNISQPHNALATDYYSILFEANLQDDCYEGRLLTSSENLSQCQDIRPMIQQTGCYQDSPLPEVFRPYRPGANAPATDYYSILFEANLQDDCYEGRLLKSSENLSQCQDIRPMIQQTGCFQDSPLPEVFRPYRPGAYLYSDTEDDMTDDELMASEGKTLYPPEAGINKNTARNLCQLANYVEIFGEKKLDINSKNGINSKDLNIITKDELKNTGEICILEITKKWPDDNTFIAKIPAVVLTFKASSDRSNPLQLDIAIIKASVKNKERYVLYNPNQLAKAIKYNKKNYKIETFRTLDELFHGKGVKNLVKKINDRDYIKTLTVYISSSSQSKAKRNYQISKFPPW